MASLTPVTGTLGKKRAAHLLRRLTFGPTTAQIASFSNLNISTAVNNLLTVPTGIPSPPIDPLTGQNWVSPAPTGNNSSHQELMEHTLAWWAGMMVSESPTIYQRMVFFWHSHIPTILMRLHRAPSLYYQIQLYHYYALGNYKDLTRAICVENAMLLNLDGTKNEASNPQENFGREFLELFTVGKGPTIGPGNYTNFTEDDVKAATKVFTGWDTDTSFTTYDTVTNLAKGKLKQNGQGQATKHDSGTKLFSSAFNNTTIQPTQTSGGYATVQGANGELTNFINMIFNSNATAKHIVRKLYRHFVYWDINSTIESDIITPLAQQLISNNYNVKPILTTLFNSQHFYDMDTPPTPDDNIGAIIKSPLDLLVGLYKLFELQFPVPSNDYAYYYAAIKKTIIDPMKNQGLKFYEPYDVAGYEAYFQVPFFNRYWITPNYLANRYKFVSDLITTGIYDDNNTLIIKIDVVKWIENHISNPADSTILINELTDYLFPVTLDQNRINYFKNDVLLQQLPPQDWTYEWQQYQATNNDTNIRNTLEGLLIVMMQTPAFQIY